MLERIADTLYLDGEPLSAVVDRIGGSTMVNKGYMKGALQGSEASGTAQGVVAVPETVALDGAALIAEAMRQNS